MRSVFTTAVLFSVVTVSFSSIVIGLPAPAASYQSESAAYKYYSEGDELYKRGAYAEAATALAQACSYDPTTYSSRIHLNLAQCYQQLKRYDDSIKQAKLAQKFDPSDSFAFYLMALAYSELKRDDLCIANLQRYIKSPNAIYVSEARELMQRMKIYGCTKDGCDRMAKGRFREAIKLFEIAATEDPSSNSGCIHGNLCYAYRMIGNSSRAVSEGKKALTFDPNDAGVVYNIAIAYQDQAKFDDSISYLRRYLTMESDGNRRTQAEQLISELLEDRKKLKSADNKLPDYMDVQKRNGRTWTFSSARMPLKVYMHPGTNVSGYKSIYRSFVLKALDTWCQASGKKVNYKLAKTRDSADIVVRWTPNALAAESESRVVSGLTTPQSDGEDYSMLVELRTTDAFTPGAFVKDGEMGSVTMHEIGHALGLDHSNYIYDVMYFRSSSMQDGMPSKRDKATLAKLYQDHPVIAFTVNPDSTPKGPPIVFLPPPTFAPPKLPDNSKILPPMFTPPPLKEKLPPPPMFTPPPVKKTVPPNAIPTFMPPPVKKSPRNSSGSGSSGGSPSPFFMPPPVK
ncbi:MAG: tetratricopeptide repeat protein [Candidatus Melainabacteria bacterium]|nr:tetratricopeptide repeat protein [Candidatus Melainabacteria bacterium]